MSDKHEPRSSNEIIEENLKILEDINDAADASVLNNRKHIQYQENREKMELVNKAAIELTKKNLENSKLDLIEKPVESDNPIVEVPKNIARQTLEDNQLKSIVGPVIGKKPRYKKENPDYSSKSYYEALGVRKGASNDEIQEALDNMTSDREYGHVSSKELEAAENAARILFNHQKGVESSDSFFKEKEIKVEMVKPEGASLSDRLTALENKKEEREHLEAQLKGEKVYHFKEGVKQYLTVEDIRPIGGKWVARLVAYNPDGSVDWTKPKYSVDKIKFKHWKKELPQETEEKVFVRNDDGSYGDPVEAKEVKISPEDLVRYKYEGGVAYAKRTERRPEAPEGAVAPKSGTSAPGELDLDMESWSDEEIAISNRIKDLQRRVDELNDGDIDEDPDLDEGDDNLEDGDTDARLDGGKSEEDTESNQDDGSPSEAGIDQGEPIQDQPVKEKPRVGFWGRLFGFGKSKPVEVGDLEEIPNREEEASEGEIRILRKKELSASLDLDIRTYTREMGKIDSMRPYIESLENLKGELEDLRENDLEFEEKLQNIREKIYQLNEKIKTTNTYQKIEMNISLNISLRYYTIRVGETKLGAEYIKKIKDLQGELSELGELQPDFKKKLADIGNRKDKLEEKIDNMTGV